MNTRKTITWYAVRTAGRVTGIFRDSKTAKRYAQQYNPAQTHISSRVALPLYSHDWVKLEDAIGVWALVPSEEDAEFLGSLEFAAITL